MSGKTKQILLVIAKVLLTVLLILAAGCIGLVTALTGGSQSPKLLSIAATLTPLAFILVIWVRNKRRILLATAAVLGAIWCVCGVEYAVLLHQKHMTIKTDVNIDLDCYMPFETNTKIVKLPEESTLRLNSDLPRLDGAAAVFPVYSAFVNAVYPDSTELSRMSSDENAPFKYLNTVEGYRALAEKKTDIFFGAYPSEEQIAYAEKFGTEFEYTPIGREAFVFFVNAKSDVDNLSSDDIRRIYSGEVKDWSELGFKPGEIKAFQRNQGSGSQSMFLRFMGDVAPAEPPKEERVDFMMGAYEVVSDYINNRGAIGFSFRYYIETVIGRKDVKLISVDGVAPTVENIKSGAYPLTGDLYAVTWKGNPNKNVEVLLDWITGPQGQYIIEKTGYAPVS